MLTTSRLPDQLVHHGADIELGELQHRLAVTLFWLQALTRIQQLRWQVADVHFATRGHHRDPAAGVFKLANVAGPWQVSQVLLGFGFQ